MSKPVQLRGEWTPRMSQVVAEGKVLGKLGPPPSEDSAILLEHKTPTPSVQINIQYAKAFQPLFMPYRYKIFFGGRGGAKSWSIARALINIAHTRKVRIGCFRELQNSIKDSVHRLITDQINEMGLAAWFLITQQSIVSTVTGAEFLFKGLRHNATEIKSTEGIDIAWVEEAQLVSHESWELLIPTIRKEGSEIWISLNPIEATDATYKRFILNTPPNSAVVKVGWQDNPWFPKTLEAERLHMLGVDPEAYEHVWEGACKVIGDAVIFKGKYVIHPFETPTDPAPRFFHGADFGFATDPAVLLRSYITKNEPIQVAGRMIQTEDLWVDREAFGYGVETDDLCKLYDMIETARSWPIKADSSRPETISYLKRMGFNIAAAEKWKGSVEDGIYHLKNFKQIHIHSDCVHMGQEARLYSYKVDKVNGDILPEIVDKHNHGWDSQRYALDGFIHHRGLSGQWAKLGKAN